MARIDALAPTRPARRLPTAFGLACACAALALIATIALAAASVAQLATGGEGAGGDFASIYAAAHTLAYGDRSLLYDAATQRAAQFALYPGRLAHENPFVLPAFVAWAIAPLARLNFGVAFAVWCAINAGLLAIAVRALDGELSGVPALPRRVLLGAFACSMPVAADVVFGQVDLFVCVGLLLGWRALRDERPIAAGAALSLALVKPHLLAGVVLLLIVQRRWRPLCALAAIAAPLLVVPALLAGPGVLADNIAALLSFPAASGADVVNAGTMPNWRGFVTSATGSTDVWLWLPGAAAIAIVAAGLAVRCWHRDQAGSISPRAYALAVVLPLLVSPHLHTQSLMLLFVAAALFARAHFAAASGGREDERRFAAGLLGLHALLFVLWLSAALGLSLGVAASAGTFALCAARWPRTADASELTSGEHEAAAAAA